MAQKHQRQQDRFTREYLKDLNGTRAAIAAGYSPRTAKEQAHGLLTRPHIARQVALLQQRRLDRLDVRADHVLEGLKRIATDASWRWA
jgi:phage terminase small subunit